MSKWKNKYPNLRQAIMDEKPLRIENISDKDFKIVQKIAFDCDVVWGEGFSAGQLREKYISTNIGFIVTQYMVYSMYRKVSEDIPEYSLADDCFVDDILSFSEWIEKYNIKRGSNVKVLLPARYAEDKTSQNVGKICKVFHVYHNSGNIHVYDHDSNDWWSYTRDQLEPITETIPSKEQQEKDGWTDKTIQESSFKHIDNIKKIDKQDMLEIIEGIHTHKSIGLDDNSIIELLTQKYPKLSSVYRGQIDMLISYTMSVSHAGGCPLLTFDYSVIDIISKLGTNNTRFTYTGKE